MYETLPTFCDASVSSQSLSTITYDLTFKSGAKLDSWIIWDGTSQTMQGIVPPLTVSNQSFTMTGTNKFGGTCNSSFMVTYQSKPYLNRAIPNAKIRTNQNYIYSVPPDTFVSPNGLTLKYYYYYDATWLSFDNKSMTFSGRPNSTNVGTFSILVECNDTKNQSG